MEDGIVRLLQSQERILKVISEEVQGWMDALYRDAFNPEAFMRFVAGMGIDLVKKRYRELLIKLHPDTAGVRGTDFLLQMMIAAYQQIAKERGWQ